MRTFIDVRYYLDVKESVTAEDVAAALGRRSADASTFAVASYRMLGYGAEAPDGEVVTWSERKRRVH